MARGSIFSLHLHESFDRHESTGPFFVVKHLIKSERILAKFVYTSIMLLAGLVGEVVAVTAAVVSAPTWKV